MVGASAIALWPPGAGADETAGPDAVAGGEGKREFNFFPIVGGDSDVGFGGGLLSDWAQLLPGDPHGFSWKVEDAALVTFKVRDSSLIVPFIDVWALLTIPRFGPDGRYRLELRPSYTDERTLGYYGIGNATPYPAGLPPTATEYRRIHPTLAARLRIDLVDDFYVTGGSSFTASWLDIPPDSLILRDASQGSPEVHRLLANRRSNGVELLELAFEYDTRDNETVTGRGQYHTLLARWSPALGAWMPYNYLQLDATVRFYVTPVPRWLTLSSRVVWDAFLGDPPFYELARFDDTPAIGGGKAVRGIPAQRYHGKVKLFANFEARSNLWSFTLKGKPITVGLAGFVDVGRTWTELFHAQPGLDGTGLGLKYGLGGGLRILEGRTFVVRADLAWSPDALPIGGYFDAGEIF